MSTDEVWLYQMVDSGQSAQHLTIYRDTVLSGHQHHWDNNKLQHHWIGAADDPSVLTHYANQPAHPL